MPVSSVPGAVFALCRRIALASAMALGGCAEDVATVEPSGRLDVLGPAPGFSTAALPDGWAVTGGDAETRFSVIERDGMPALKAVAGSEDAYAIRRVDAILLTTPYLSWAWNMEAHGEGQHPVRLIVGFRGGARRGLASWPRWSGLPPHDRILTLAWGDSALNRGTLAAAAEGRAWTTYTVRGGRENARTWWLETVDLGGLYAEAWPEDDLAAARLMFVGVGAAASARPAVGRVAGVQLSR